MSKGDAHFSRQVLDCYIFLPTEEAGSELQALMQHRGSGRTYLCHMVSIVNTEFPGVLATANQIPPWRSPQPQVPQARHSHCFYHPFEAGNNTTR